MNKVANVHGRSFVRGYFLFVALVITLDFNSLKSPILLKSLEWSFKYVLPSAVFGVKATGRCSPSLLYYEFECLAGETRS